MHESINMLRLITDPPLPGAYNMAADEAVLQCVNKGLSPATLRFYRWEEPTISLGYFQKHEEFKVQDEQISMMPMVRRQTGGGAILHDKELTYSLVLPITDDVERIGIEDMYRIVHDAYITVLSATGVTTGYRGGDDRGNDDRGNAQRGPFFCFSRGHCLDLVIGSDKILGSAQRRVKNAVLQHGSLIIKRRFLQQQCAELGDDFDIDSFIVKASEIIAGKLGMEIIEAVLNNDESEMIPELKEKYSGSKWNAQR